MEEIFQSNKHVPQQSRRNKLRVTLQTHQPPPLSQTSLNFSPFYPSATFNNHSSHKNPSISQFLKTTSCASSHSPPPFANLGVPSSSYSRPIDVDSASQNQQNEFRNWVPMGPFTGYASILKKSRFLKPAQQLLEDICGSFVNRVSDSPLLDSFSDNGDLRELITGKDPIKNQWRNSRLIFMLEEVYRKYTVCCQQMQSAVASFQKVAGLGNACPYISSAIKTIGKRFGCLKNTIQDQLEFSSKTCVGEKEILRLCTFGQNLHTQKSVQSLHSFQPSVLRPQRGLPDHAVAELKAWLFEHFLHPYPTDSEKHALAQQTGLSRSQHLTAAFRQVSNWFINARVRIWKPMVEEMHILEKLEAQHQEMNYNAGIPTVVGPSAASQAHMKKLAHSITSTRGAQATQTKRPREELGSENEAQGIGWYGSSSTDHRVRARGVGTDESNRLLSLAQDHTQPEFGNRIMT